MKPGFIFKSKWTRTKVAVNNAKHQWSPNDRTYAENHKQPTDRFNPFTQTNFAIHVLDNYAVHLMPTVWKALNELAYILIVMKTSITEVIQVKDTDLHLFS